jgi:hypothetical protein
MAKITVKIADGMVQTIEGIPTDVPIEVRNYDVSDVDEKNGHERRKRKEL